MADWSLFKHRYLPFSDYKILCITQIREWDGKSGIGLKKGTQNLANDHRKQIISPESTCLPGSTSNILHNAEQDRSDQTIEQPSLLTATVDGTRSSCCDDLTKRILKIDDNCSKINHPCERQLEHFETGASPKNAIERHIDIIKRKLTIPTLSSSVNERLNRLTETNESVFASSNADMGNFVSTDEGSSTVFVSSDWQIKNLLRCSSSLFHMVDDNGKKKRLEQLA